MVGQVVSSAVAPVVVNSATDEDGLVNQLFKIGILVGGLIILAIGIGILIFILNIDFGNIFDTVTSPFRSVFNVFDAGISVLTGVFSGLGFGSKNKSRLGLATSISKFNR